MDLLNKLGSVDSQFMALNTLEVGKEYLILKWDVLKTRFGRQVIITTADHRYYLPYQFEQLKDEQIAEYNSKRFVIIYDGEKKFGFFPPSASISFKEVENK